MYNHGYTAQTTLIQILNEHPWLSKRMPEIDRRFAVMNTAVGKLLLRRMSVADLGKKAGMTVEELLSRLQREIEAHEGR